MLLNVPDETEVPTEYSIVELLRIYILDGKVVNVSISYHDVVKRLS